MKKVITEVKWKVEVFDPANNIPRIFVKKISCMDTHLNVYNTVNWKQDAFR